jgi:3-deoxy-manno-octulosonate cytidylyltransferase (CMP-KDO synthetase)
MKTSVVIPARLASTRLPGKVLLDLNGWPVLRHVWERVRRMTRADEVVIATDSPAVIEAARQWGAVAEMTPESCRSGTERIISLLDHLRGDFILNVQGDEPAIDPGLLDQMVERAAATGADLVTAVAPLRAASALHSPDRVKVVRAMDGRAIYFSRSAVPFVRGVESAEWLQSNRRFWCHIGVYGYTRKVLECYRELPVSPLEEMESLEQLRFVDAGYAFQTVETEYHPVAIDTAEDLVAARKAVQPLDDGDRQHP